MPDPVPTTLDGRVVAGRYRLDRMLAAGGMAQVWEATDEVLARRVAVKILHPHLAADGTFVERFRREAVAAARLSHPAIVSIYDTCSDDGIEAIVMELVQGSTLREYLDEHRTLEPGQAVAVVAEVADALETAHRGGVIHRDIKPGNILLSSDGRVLVADFGIAKAGGDMTATNTTLGTVKYLAPEQVEGTTVDARTDVYALGIVLYEALCGRVPFAADTETATALARLHQEPMRPRNIRAGIPKPVEDVVLKAIARDPDARYPSAAAFRAALLAAGRNGAAPPRLPPPPRSGDDRDATRADVVPHPAPPHDHTPAGSSPPTFVKTERSWLVPALVIGLVAAALVVAGLAVANNRTSSSSSSSNAPSPDAKPVTISAVKTFDPEGDQTENDGDAAKAIDGDPATLWQTSGYDDRTFGHLKSGVGLVVQTAQDATFDSITINSPTNDWSFSVYVGDDPNQAKLDGWGDPVTQKEHVGPGPSTVSLGGHKGRAVLVWITDLGDGQLDNGGRVHARIAEISLSAK